MDAAALCLPRHSYHCFAACTAQLTMPPRRGSFFRRKARRYRAVASASVIGTVTQPSRSTCRVFPSSVTKVRGHWLFMTFVYTIRSSYSM